MVVMDENISLKRNYEENRVKVTDETSKEGGRFVVEDQVSPADRLDSITSEYVPG